MSDDESVAKKPKLSNENQQNQASVAVSSAEIFRLNSDCFDQIFEYLSIDHVSTLGQTCKKMQKLCGEYLKHNVCLEAAFAEFPEFYPALGKYVVSVTIGQSIENHTFHPLYAIDSDIENSSINEITFIGIDLSTFNLSFNVQKIRNILEMVKIVSLDNCSGYFPSEFYNDFLKYCKNMTHLYIHATEVGIPQLYRADFDVTGSSKEFDNDSQMNLKGDKHLWLNQNYPNLEYLDFFPRAFGMQGHKQMRKFLERHPNIKTFTCPSICIRDYHLLEKSSIQLDVLKTFITDRSSFKYFPILYEQKFYKRLFVIIHRTKKSYCDHLVTLPGLEQLTILKFRDCFSLPSLTNLKELVINSTVDPVDMETLAKGLTRLERIQLTKATPESIVPFIRYSVNLRKFKMELEDETSEEPLDLVALNKEREKLFQAKHVVLYVEEQIFLATKWAVKNGDINLRLVAMKYLNLYKNLSGVSSSFD